MGTLLHHPSAAKAAGAEGDDPHLGLHSLPPVVNPAHEAGRAAQRSWRRVPVSERLRIVRRLRRLVASSPDHLVAAVRGTGPRSAAEVFVSELLPMAEACRFLEREARALLAPRYLGGEGRPLWLGPFETEIHREPLGLVLIVAPAGHPLFLPGVQAIQALVAGNAVLWLPGPGGGGAARVLATLAREAGLPSGLMQILDESPEAERTAIAGGVDRVLFSDDDLIVANADPRVPVAVRRESSFGVIGGAEGLLALTVPKVIQTRPGWTLPPLAPPHPRDALLFRAVLALLHGGGPFTRLRAVGDLFRALAGRGAPPRPGRTGALAGE